MRYSPERKEAVVRKMMPPHNRSIKQLAQEEGISEATLLKGFEYRYLAVREPMQDQLILPGMEEYKRDLPFQSMVRDKTRHKVFGIVTNMDWDGQELIEWHYKRCGRSEEAHSVMKEDRLQSECCTEVTGSGRKMGTQADESDAGLPRPQKATALAVDECG
ncbi:MAG: hypothetical protein JRF46_14070 [Deltaproteobacteria bacterium]|nr:hypothetical protein [Deltaproteobacteria bacterium]